MGPRPVEWVRWLLPSPTPRLEDHVSIWSIRANDAGTFFRIVAVLWLVALLRISYNAMERADVPLVGWQIAVDFALAVLGEFGNVGIGTAMLAMLLTRPVNRMGETAMTFYQAMVNRFVIPVIEKHKAEGREEGRAEADSEWTAWNRRRVEAERQGIAFDETPPRR